MISTSRSGFVMTRWKRSTSFAERLVAGESPRAAIGRDLTLEKVAEGVPARACGDRIAVDGFGEGPPRHCLGYGVPPLARPLGVEQRRFCSISNGQEPRDKIRMLVQLTLDVRLDALGCEPDRLFTGQPDALAL